ncbi:MAG: DUF3887 domain-containing protein [Candidatus Riflebacteria bacterium]|nr:DUF3887 domain-containing protein [Candidatus Riflebacteria bacterium]
MKNIIILAVLFSFTSTIVSFADEKKTSVKKDLYIIAEDFIKLLSKGDYEQATNNFDNTMKNVLPAEKLQEAWEKVCNANGAFDSTMVSRFEKAERFEIIYVTCHFQKGSVDAKVVFDSSEKITGLFFLNSEKAREFTYTLPTYASIASFSEQEIRFGSAPWQLPGTVTIPKGKGPFPLLVLVHGSGPQDRDETIGPNKPFRDLSAGLGSLGIATLRYEKRTRHYSQLSASLKNDIDVEFETILDAVEAAKAARTIDKIDSKKIFLLGHSLGGYLIPRIAVKAPEIAGYVIMAGNCRPMEDLILAQTKYIFSLEGPLSEEKKDFLKKLEQQIAAVKNPKLSKDTPAETLPFGICGKYWLSLKDYAPEKLASTIKRPFFVIQGGRDYQVTSEDLGIWQKGLLSNASATFKLYPALNHIFLHGEGKCSPSEYELPGNIYEPVIKDIANWIKSVK